LSDTLPKLDKVHPEELGVVYSADLTMGSKIKKKTARPSKEEKTIEATAVGLSNPTTPNVAPSKRRKQKQLNEKKETANHANSLVKNFASADRNPPIAVAEKEEKVVPAEVDQVKIITKKRQKSHNNTEVRRKTRTTTTSLNGDHVTTPPGPAIAEEEEVLEDNIEEATVTTTIVVKKQRKKREPDPLPCTDPTAELLRCLEEENFIPGSLPIPNLGYACLCMELRELNPPVFTSRDCIKRTLDTKGISHLGELTLANCKDLARVIQYNQERNIRFFRMSSVLQPWMGVHDIKSFPQFEEICTALQFAGKLARKYGQRLTFHPSHFVKLAAESDSLVEKSIAELEAHSLLLDLMEFTPASPENKINIHVGGVYGNKPTTLERWAKNYKRLSPNCRARVTVENDDVASSYSVDDLLILHRLCDGTLPIVFDFHHYKFCPGELTEEEAFHAAIATWPQGIRPVVHWSESQRGRKPHAHSDYVRGPIFLHGLEKEVDVMIESKCKERALLAYRDGLPIPEDPIDSGDEDEGVVDAEALKFL
jgi:UV DNA damage endonuclease